MSTLAPAWWGVTRDPRLPGDAPELNPAESPWQNIKGQEPDNFCADGLGTAAVRCRHGGRTSASTLSCSFVPAPRRAFVVIRRHSIMRASAGQGMLPVGHWPTHASRCIKLTGLSRRPISALTFVFSETKLFTMKTASVREIRLAFPSVLKAIQDGESVAITSRRKIVATLCPPPRAPARPRPWADVDDWLASQPRRTLNVAAILSADRDDLR